MSCCERICTTAWYFTGVYSFLVDAGSIPFCQPNNMKQQATVLLCIHMHAGKGTTRLVSK
jgi:hypothetical protein